jgi:hypothetical protein
MIIATLPRREMTATAYPTSRFSARMSDSVAAIADAPQMAVPTAISSATSRPARRRRLTRAVPPSVARIVSVTITAPAHPTAAMSLSAILRPSNATPMRSSVRAARPVPAAVLRYGRTTGAASTPMRTAAMTGLSDGISAPTPKAAATTAPTTTRPGR